MALNRKEYVVKRMANGRTRLYVIPCETGSSVTFNAGELQDNKLIDDYKLLGFEEDFEAVRAAVKALLNHEFVEFISIFPNGYMTVVIKQGANMDIDGEILDQSLLDSSLESTEFVFRLARSDEY
jgi:hypothetical protein